MPTREITEEKGEKEKMKKIFSIVAIFVIVLSTFSILTVPINADSLVWSEEIL